jgi:branched-chain amino acid transport system substrate-binding protein
MRPWRPLSVIPVVLAVGVAAYGCGGNGDDASEREGDEVGTPTPMEAAPTVSVDDPTEPQPGVSPSEVIVGTHNPQTGPAAIYSDIPRAMEAYFQNVGPINGRDIRLVVRDNAFSPEETIEAVRQLIEEDQVFAILNGLGTQTHEQVFAELAEQGIPDLLIASGASKFDEPVVETAFVANNTYTFEGRVLGEIALNNGYSSAALVYQDDDFGLEGAAGFKETVGSSVEITAEETFPVGAAEVTPQVINAVAGNPEVLYIYALPVETAAAIKAARDQGYGGQIMISGVAIINELGDLAGPENLEDTISTFATKIISQADDPDIQAHVELMEAAGITPTNFTIYGQAIAEAFVEILRNSTEPLTRESLVTAAEELQDFVCSVCLGPVNFSDDDHRANDTLTPARFVDGQWIAFGEPISAEDN